MSGVAFKNMKNYSEYPIASGSQVVNAGTKLIAINTITLQIRYGAAPLKMSTIGILLILLHAFRHIPTGGVTSPIARPVIIIAPNCRAENP
jgi:hypothetical protein